MLRSGQLAAQFRAKQVAKMQRAGAQLFVLQNIERLRSLGKCILYSTHIMREVEKLCDRVAIISRGLVLADGTLDELRQRHGQKDLEELFFSLIS